MKNIFQILDHLAITYEKYDHPPFFTVADADKFDLELGAGHSKNLFLQNRAGNKYYLVVLESQKRADLKNLAKSLNERGLSFASTEKLRKFLGVTPGAVSPFGLINDGEKGVVVIVDQEIMKNEKVGFHPNKNTATLIIKTSDFQKFLSWSGHRTIFFSF